MNTQTPARPSFWSTVGIVAKREIVVRCMSKSFIISTLIILAIMFFAVVFTPQLGKLMSGGNTTVAVTADLAPKLSALPHTTVIEVADQDAARNAVLSEEANAAVVPDASNPLRCWRCGTPRPACSRPCRCLRTFSCSTPTPRIPPFAISWDLVSAWCG